MHAGFIDTEMAAGVSGEKVSPEERACIEQIDAALSLRGNPAAAAVLRGLEPTA